MVVDKFTGSVEGKITCFTQVVTVFQRIKVIMDSVGINLQRQLGICTTILLEKKNDKETASCSNKVKILGTLLCVLGALTMKIMQSEKNSTLQLSTTPSGFILKIQKIIGFFYLVVAVMILSSNFVLQAGPVSGIWLSFNGWTVKKRGPVFVSMFSPIVSFFILITNTSLHTLEPCFTCSLGRRERRNIKWR
ncbi:hypothetical protein PHAVU_002G058800 [Phaseolus vulgaris]|uniref:WAT1-related protein n=1 Tax=Phaseolus vulgaris TaxID=3885 RepID=V7CJ33_PHAVU|nr:hypothetical protein PHAVU_002G058800g [Phaseolus vulgaris]ESW29300.1 hypothetical protein PHAVU_002G058800g [Phaseolus vulgaris]